MEIKKNSIVRKLDTNEVYEVISISGNLIIGVPININSLKGVPVPLKVSEIEMLMEEETDAFNLLFRDDDDGQKSN